MEHINPKGISQKRKAPPSVSACVKGILQGNRVLLSQAITLVESKRKDRQEAAQQIISACLPYIGNSIRIGITGAPGVGKSTFIEALGLHIIKAGHKVAVLTIDPSSPLSKGSILGDKTRMQHLSTHTQAYIRPSAAGDSLGGVARNTRESIILCEAAGYDVIIVETVGVGQSETMVHSMTDFFMLLLLPGAGDELQGIKRGIVEMADLVAVNKADGDRETMARQAQVFYKNALHLFPSKESKWRPQVLTCSAISGKSIDTIWQLILDFQSFTQNNNFYYDNRKMQAKYWLYESIEHELKQLFYTNPSVKNNLQDIEAQVLNGKMSPFQGAEALLKHIKP
jgi:LAO/AO transport system kinase